MRNLTEIFLKRHPKWSNEQANNFIISQFGIHSRVMNVTHSEGTYHFNVQNYKNLFNNITNIIQLNNLFENEFTMTPDLETVEQSGINFDLIELALGKTRCVGLTLKYSYEGYLIITLEAININNSCQISPRLYLENLKLFLNFMKQKLKNNIIFKIEQDISSVFIKKNKYTNAFETDYTALESFFLQFDINAKLFSIFEKPFQNPHSLLYKFEEYFEEIFRKPIDSITLKHVFLRITKMNYSSKFNIIVFFSICALISENTNIIDNANTNNTNNIINEHTNQQIIDNFLNQFFEVLEEEKISLSLRNSRILSDGKPWYMIFFNGLNYCSYNSSSISYENDNEYDELIEEVRNTIIEHKIKGQNISVKDFMAQFNEEVKNENTKLYFYDLMLYYKFERKVDQISKDKNYYNYCMMVE